MKKTLSSLAMLSLVSSFSAQAAYEYNVSALFLQPTNTNLDYAIYTVPLPLPTPNWSIQTIDPAYSPGFNVGARYIVTGCGKDAEINWTHLHSSDNANVNSNNGGNFVGPFYQIGPNSNDINQTTGQAKTRFDVLNLDVGKLINWGGNFSSRLGAGLTTAYLKHQLTSFYQDATGDIVKSETTSKYMGLGPRLGADLKYAFTSDFGIVGQIAGSVLVGRAKPHVAYTSSSGTLAGVFGIATNNQDIDAPHTTQVIPALDAKLGLNYAFHLNQCYVLTIEGGYEAGTYINSLITYYPTSLAANLQTGTIAVNTMGQSLSNFSYNGVYLNFSLLV